MRRGSCPRLGVARSPHPAAPHMRHRPLWPARTRGSRTTRSPVPPATPYAVSRQSLSMALLEFFSGAAPARLVSSRQLAGSSCRSRSAVAACAGRRRTAPRRLGRLCFLFLFSLLGGSNCDTQDRLGDSARDSSLHLFEEAVRLALVGHEWVLLAVAPKIDALAKLLHRGEVLDPVRVDRAKKDPSLHRTRELLSQLLLARLVRFFDDLRHTVTQLVLIAQVPEARGHEVRTIQHRPETRGELFAVPVLGVRRRSCRVDEAVRLLPQKLEDGLADVALFQDEPALAVDHGALVVENVVELERALPDVEVAPLDLDLGLRDRDRDHAGFDRRRVLETAARHEPGDALRGEDADQVVLERAEEPGAARVALTAGPAAKLVVDAPRFVALGADDVEPAEVGDALSEQDVDTAAGHVRRERDGAALAGIRDDQRFALVVLRVQDLVLDPVPAQLVRKPLALLDACRADEHRLPGLVALLHLGDDGVPLALLGLVDEIGVVLADHWLVRRDLRDLELVHLEELLGLGRRRTGHPRELRVHAEVVLDRDRREGPGLALDLETFLRLAGLVEPIAPAAAGHEPAGELVDDDHLAVLDDVLLVLPVESARSHRVVEVMHGGHVALVHVLHAEQLLGARDALLGECDRVLLLFDDVVGVRLELRRDARERVVRLGRVLGWGADDEWRARFHDVVRGSLGEARVLH